MMENYEEVKIDERILGNRENAHSSLDFQKSAITNFLNCSDSEANKQDFLFGAEIANTSVTLNEDAMKTNSENKTITEHNNEEEIDNILDKPLNVVELNLTEHVNGFVSATPEAQEDGDDNDSYQTDEDNEENAAELEQDRESGGLNSPDESDDSSTDSDFSDLSGLSDVSGREWKPISARPINWVQKQIHSGANPRELLSQILPSSAPIAPNVNDMLLWRILASMLSEPPRRQKLRHINTFEDVIQLVHQSKNIIVLTGAGVSVSCGIPDFRSSDGIYSRLAKDYPNLPDPQAMFDINYFSRDPRPFYKFAREIYPGQFKPSPCHRFIKLLEQKQKLLRNYTQNIDTLEQVAGIRNIIECHGSFSTASCTKCKQKCSADDIRDDIFAQRIPVCHRCQPNVHQSVDASQPVSEIELKQLVANGIMKPDIVFFGEGLPEEFHTVMANDKDKCDLLIVMGSSLKVRPVALIPSSIPANVPQILINREQLHHLEFDVELLGDSDVIINQLCHRLGDDWKDICFKSEVLMESKELLPLEDDTTTTEGEDDVQQMHDTDTQSVKSSVSMDLALRLASTYSDSGFESSTSCGVMLTKATHGHTKANECIEKIKTSIIEFNESLSKTVNDDLLPPDLLEEPIDDVDFGNPGFHPFTEHSNLGDNTNTTQACASNYRHLSVDSSKDSGIQCDSSNSALAISSNTGPLVPPITNFGYSGGTNANTIVNDSRTPASQHSNSEAAVKSSQRTSDDNNMSDDAIKRDSGNIKRPQQKRQTAADRLISGTYYCHESSSSYVFPGAQVSWCSDSEEDEDEECENEYDDDANTAPISPLLPPSVEAEVVSEITRTNTAALTTTISTTTTRVHCNKRRFMESDAVEIECNSYCTTAMTSNNSDTITDITTSCRSNDSNSDILVCNPPPIKRRCSSNADSPLTEPRGLHNADATSASVATTIYGSKTTLNDNSLEINNTSVTTATTEALLTTNLDLN